MSDIPRLQDASEWVQRLHESDAQELADAWLQWCRSDPRNLPAFEQMQRLWNALPKPRDTNRHPAEPVPVARPTRRRVVALAASVALLVAAAAWIALSYSQIEVQGTAAGEQRHIALADGSQLYLAPNSRVSARFTLTRRDVRLEGGQAFFAVAHSALRPFVVHANDLTVTAVGTAFDVRIGPSSTVVTVGEGRVTVAPGRDMTGGSGADIEAVRAGVGERVSFSKSARRLSVASVDPGAAGSWRQGKLQFLGEPLEDVVAAVNRYSATRILLVPALRQTRFTGTVSAAGVRDWLGALQQIYAVEVVDQGVNGILIRSRGSDGTHK